MSRFQQISHSHWEHCTDKYPVRIDSDSAKPYIRVQKRSVLVNVSEMTPFTLSFSLGYNNLMATMFSLVRCK